MSPLHDLLSRTSAAHGRYEATVLGGVYDEAWAGWYARWAVDNGFNDLVEAPVTAAVLSRLLLDINEEHQRTDRRQSWAAFTASWLAHRLGERRRAGTTERPELWLG